MKDLETKVNCPGCGRPLNLKLKEMVPGRSKLCPSGCGATLQFSGGDGRKTQAALDELGRALRRFGRG